MCVSACACLHVCLRVRKVHMFSHTRVDLWLHLQCLNHFLVQHRAALLNFFDSHRQCPKPCSTSQTSDRNLSFKLPCFSRCVYLEGSR